MFYKNYDLRSNKTEAIASENFIKFLMLHAAGNGISLLDLAGNQNTAFARLINKDYSGFLGNISFFLLVLLKVTALFFISILAITNGNMG